MFYANDIDGDGGWGQSAELSDAACLGTFWGHDAASHDVDFFNTNNSLNALEGGDNGVTGDFSDIEEPLFDCMAWGTTVHQGDVDMKWEPMFFHGGSPQGDNWASTVLSAHLLQDALPSLDPTLSPTDFQSLCDEFFLDGPISDHGVDHSVFEGSPTLNNGLTVIDLTGDSTDEEAGNRLTKPRTKGSKGRKRRTGTSKTPTKHVTLSPTALILGGVEYAWNNRCGEWRERDGGVKPKQFTGSLDNLSYIEVRPDYCGFPIRLEYDKSSGCWHGMNDFMRLVIKADIAQQLVQQLVQHHSVLMPPAGTVTFGKEVGPQVRSRR